MESIPKPTNTEEICLNLGPQHPSTHGVMKFELTLEGERVVKCVPVIGQLHRGLEKMAEGMLYSQFIPMTDRLDYLAGACNNLGYVLAVETLMGVEAPERAKYIRVIISELQRIASHLVAVGTMALDLGAWTVMLYSFREREMILDIFEMYCGARMTLNCFRVGGTPYDLTPEIIQKIEDFLKVFPSRLDDYEALLNKNPIWLTRTRDIGVISAEDAIAYGLSGPNLRASGVEWDIRKAYPYEIYDRVEFDIPTGSRGDVYDRYWVRMEEMRQSCRIIRQALDQMPEGPIMVDIPGVSLADKAQFPTNFPAVVRHFELLVKGFQPPKREIYVGVENPKGELGFYLVSDGTGRPYRLKIRAPSFVSAQILPKVMKGTLLADVVSILASFDPVMGEIDR
ncbi:NADH dehydrogenase (quinone) subunit D [Calderihabitans maritimus]|nr:NADH dehydrogenase (quinone) subunit D [Calderihabitans maritimus]